jgi:hemerythrin superfamily protein
MRSKECHLPRFTGSAARRSGGGAEAQMAGRNGAKARSEVLELLKRDHKRVKKAFSDFEKLGAHERERCAVLVERTCAELEVHAALEEELFYPIVRAAIDEPGLVDEAEVEHRALKMLILELDRLEPGDEKQIPVFNVLAEYTRHHVRQEENRIFEQTAHARVDWEALLQDMQQRRAELMEEIGVATIEFDAELAPDEKNHRAVGTVSEIDD